MNLPVYTYVLFVMTLGFGAAAVVFSVLLDKTKKDLKAKDELAKRRIYEISMLKAIQDRISYSLNIEHIIDTITNSLKNLIPYSTVSSIVLENDKLLFKIYVDERVNSRFIEQVKKSMVASLGTIIDRKLPDKLEEIRQGLAPDDTNTQILASFFHIPLVVNGKIVGLINVSSTEPGLYKEADMTILYQMTNQASIALSKLKEVLGAEESKLFAMISNMSDGVFMVDQNNQLTLINNTAKEILGLKVTQPTIFDVISSLSHDFDFSAKIEEALTQNKTIEEKDLQLGNKSVQVVITPVLMPNEDQKNIVLGATITLHDITAEKALAKLKEEFTSSIVHELRSPLTALKAGSELMLTEKDKLDEAQQTKLIEIIHEQSDRMLSDINSLLDAAKLESGHFTVFQKGVNITDILQQSAELFAAAAKKKQITISFDIDPNLPRGFFDANRITQVLNNLISNSLKFTPAGGSIIIHARKYFNEYLPKTKTNPGILIAVSDTGIGIPKEKQGLLFSKFAQIENLGYIHGAGGTGLGLYICKGIIEAHGGNIFLQSIPNHGTTVSFTLPIAKDIDVSPVKDAPTASTPLHASLLVN